MKLQCCFHACSDDMPGIYADVYFCGAERNGCALACRTRDGNRLLMP